MADSTMIGDIRALVQEGRAALIAGDTYTARQRFRQVIEQDPNLVDAWIGMAGAVRPYREKREHLLRALAIDPENIEAKAILAQVDARLAAGEVLAPGGVQVREPLDAALLPASTPPLEPAKPSTFTESDTLYCYNHPNRETGLRCTNCERPICSDCVRPAAVGQLCPECARARRPVNYQVSAGSLFVSGLVAFIYGIVVSVLAGFILVFAGWFSLIIAFMFGPAAGELLVRLLERINRKRGQAIQVVVGISYGIGALPVLLFTGLPIGGLIFAVAALITAITRLR